MASNEPYLWTGYDQMPNDHDRCIRPTSKLNQIMESDRQWFNTLNAYSQALVLLELLNISGGPLVLDVFRKVENMYLVSKQIETNLMVDCETVTDRDTKANQILNTSLRNWALAISSYRDSLKLEEMEMTMKDNSKTRFWVVNRPKTENNETIDFIQLLPASLGKRILSYLPRESMSSCASVNKYWAYLVEDLRSEITVRLKFNIQMTKLKEIIDEHNTIGESSIINKKDLDVKTFGNFMKKKKKLCRKFNMKILHGTLDFRGAADEKIFQ